MKLIPAAALLAASLAGPLQAAAQAPVQPADQPFTVLRADDRSLTCEQLITENNALEARIVGAKTQQEQTAAQQQATRARRGMLGGLARNVLTGVASSAFGGAGGGVAGHAAYVGGNAAAHATADAIAMSGRNTGAPAGGELEKQRLDRVKTLISEKRC